MELAEIRRKASGLIQQCNPDGLVPFPFDRIVSQRQDIELLFLDNISDTISGAIYYQHNKFTILINKQKAPVRQYFTTAHEFGHYFLHEDWLRSHGSNGFVDYAEMLDGDSMLLRPDEPITTVDLQKEREANNFAAELVMPEDKVREFWDLTHDIEKCANAFQVSKSALVVRLERLHLVS